MIANKHISKIIIAIMAVAVILCMVAALFSDRLSDMMGGSGISLEYESKLFDTDEIITIDIQMDAEEWDQMLANATAEEYYSCDIVINGKKYSDVGIRPKGNTSLSSIAMDSTTDRYSFKVEFDHFVENQTCYGLDKLILNNNYADATNMKETVVYDMFQYLGADASLYNYAKISVNGEYWGVYLALEGVEDSFMLRNYGTQTGELYKPEGMQIGGGPGGDDNGPGGMPDFAGEPSGDSDFPDFAGEPSGDLDFPGFGGDASGDSGFLQGPPGFGGDASGDFEFPDFEGFGGGFGSNGGANLNYSDDELDSYSTIWNSEITKTTDSDHRRLVNALKNINDRTDLDTYMDIDNILRYMAVHVFSVNMDSLSGSMAHNYYIYEYDSKVNIIPWDYNLSWGGMSMGNSGNATDMINDAIDDSFDSTNFFDALLENEEYAAIYHSYLQQLVDEYVAGGRFEELYKGTREKIDQLVATDPNAFYSYEEYDAGAEMLYDTILLRAMSIAGQLDGSIPSTEAGQKADPSNLVDSSAIDISVMGEFGMGGDNGGPGGDGGPGGNGGPGDFGDFGGDGGPEGFAMASGDAMMPGDFAMTSGDAMMPGGFNMASGDARGPGGGGFPGQNPQQSQSQKNKQKEIIIMLGICLGIMLVSFVFVKSYKRKRKL